MDAAVWGYHSFFPDHSPKPTPACNPGRLKRIANVLDGFDPATLVMHLESAQEDLPDLKDRVGLSAHLNLVEVEELAQLDFVPWTPAEIRSHQLTIATLLGAPEK